MNAFTATCRLVLLALLLPAAACATDFFTDFPLHRYRVVEVTYTPAGWPEAQKGDLYLPRNKSGPFPVVLLVHGGSWQHGGRGNMSRIAAALAGHGYAAFSVDYRLAPRYRHPAQLEDLEQALRWVQANAGPQDLDPGRIAAWGYSAGAHLVCLLAVQPPSPGRPALQAVVAGGTPADLRIYPDSPAVTALLGDRLIDNPARYEEASPLAHVHAGLPPFFLYHGADDDLVTPAQAEHLAGALAQAGVPVELLRLPGYGHVRAALFLGRTLPAALEFLAQRLVGGGG